MRSEILGDIGWATEQEVFFDSIVMIADKRPVTAEDFAPFVGCHNWLLMDREDMSFDWRVRNDDKQIITKFTLQRILDNGKVEIMVDIGIGSRSYLYDTTSIRRHIDADELAIRMDAS